MKKFKFSIIGYPLKKPRSIPLWKDFFKGKKINHSMKAIEVKPEKINLFLKNFNKDTSFAATAVTMPLKERLFKKVKVIDKISKYAESINLIIKNKGNLIGFNTDIYGLLKCIPKNYKKVMIIGFGGTGKATFKVLSNIKKKTKFFIITSKYLSLRKAYKKKSVFIKKIDNENLKELDLIINCTPLGSNLNKRWVSQSPLSESQMTKLNKNCFIFDLVYEPRNTLLSKLAKKYSIKYMGGLKMNTLQAKKALKIVYHNIDKA